MSKVYVEVKVRLIMIVDDDTEVSQVINEMEYDFTDKTGSATIEDMEIIDHEVTDAK